MADDPRTGPRRRESLFDNALAGLLDPDNQDLNAEARAKMRRWISEDFESGRPLRKGIHYLAQLVGEEYGDSSDDVISKGLVLYRLAQEASKAGERLAILAPDDEIVLEVQGIDSDDPKLVTYSK